MQTIEDYQTSEKALNIKKYRLKHKNQYQNKKGNLKEIDYAQRRKYYTKITIEITGYLED